jgi:hypothetical protein
VEVELRREHLPRSDDCVLMSNVLFVE